MPRVRAVLNRILAHADTGQTSLTERRVIGTAESSAARHGCTNNTIGLSSDDLKHFATHVDLYAGRGGSDLLIITLSDKTLGATATISLTTSHYGQTTDVSAPPSATNLAAMFAQLGLH